MTGPAGPPAVSPWPGLVAVLMGVFISTLASRLVVFGLPDIRGAMHAGFDEGAWITTAQACGEVAMAPVSIWAGAVFGPRRILFAGAVTYAVAAALSPLAPGLGALLVLQTLSGFATGAFIPMAIVHLARNMGPRGLAYGVAAYALTLEAALNVAATLAGWYVDHLSWRWLFWQGVPLAAAMAWWVLRALPRQPANMVLLRDGDWFAILSLGIGLVALYIALDHGNRLDWLASGLIVGLLTTAALSMLAFVAHEWRAARPWIDLRYIARSRIPHIMLLMLGVRLAILSSALLLPQFLSSVQGFRPNDTGPALLAIAVPQLVFAPLVALLLRLVDARATLALGFALVAAACWMPAAGLTGAWMTADFLPSQALQSAGQLLALSSLVFLAVTNIRPSAVLTFGAMLQVARLLGGEIGTAGVGTWLRLREQLASNLLGLHVHAGPLLTERLVHGAALVQARAFGAAGAEAQATALLAGSVHAQATVQSFLDGYAVVGAAMVAAMLLAAAIGPAPDHPALPRRRAPDPSGRPQPCAQASVRAVREERRKAAGLGFARIGGEEHQDGRAITGIDLAAPGRPRAVAKRGVPAGTEGPGRRALPAGPLPGPPLSAGPRRYRRTAGPAGHRQRGGGLRRKCRGEAILLPHRCPDARHLARLRRVRLRPALHRSLRNLVGGRVRCMTTTMTTIMIMPIRRSPPSAPATSTSWKRRWKKC